MKIKLLGVTLNKYKSIKTSQNVKIEPDITTIVGMNESGKTSFLEAIAKMNYFSSDKDFEFDRTIDYPRSELIDFEDSDDDVEAMNCEFEISDELLNVIAEDLGRDVFNIKSFNFSYSYKSEQYNYYGINPSLNRFIKNICEKFNVEVSLLQGIIDSPLTFSELEEKLASIENIDIIKEKLNEIKSNSYESWENKLDGYVIAKYIKPNMPKFWYFDEYYALPNEIKIAEINNSVYKDEGTKTARALFELAKINPQDIINTNEYERFMAQLEASSNKITSEIFKYWSANSNLDIDFRIKDRDAEENQTKLLDIRVRSQRHKITLPLGKRSKGFNWFFSFIVWFSKIQADKNSDYILLLDEPGLNLHASAQADLLRFIEDLSSMYQVIYTTHSPFMIKSDKLHRVRTCVETEQGTIISDSIKEKDSRTLFPLQAALGYDIAQNLFISKNNLLVEGPSDLIYLTILSNILETEKRTHLDNSVTIVPVGGLDKVVTFVALLKGNKLNVSCLLDSFTDQSGKQRMEDLIKNKIIKDKHIRFFHEFTNNGKSTADIEDLFKKEDYIKLFNVAFKGEIPEIEANNLDSSINTVVKQISKVIGNNYNHYRPANKLNQMGVNSTYFSTETLDNFEKMFIEINKLF